MDTLIRLYDAFDDFLIATASRFRRALTRTPRERRKTPRAESADDAEHRSPAARH